MQSFTLRSSVLVLLSSLLSIQVGAAPVARQASPCNGFSAFCDRPYSNVSFVGAHDSAFVGFLPTENQHDTVSQQLDTGIRFLQGQTHVLNGNLELCHTSCLEEDAGSLQDYLSSVKSFLDANPNEVVTLLLVNGDHQSPALFDQSFQAAGLSQYGFVPATSPNPLPIGSWPTLGGMIAAGQRLVVFLDYNADVTVVPYLLDEFSYFFETPYDTTDPSFSECSIDRPAGADPAGRMYLVNHFLDISIFGLDIPDSLDAANTNSMSDSSGIGTQVSTCVGLYDRFPNVVLLDYLDQGYHLAAQQALNNL